MVNVLDIDIYVYVFTKISTYLNFVRCSWTRKNGITPSTNWRALLLFTGSFLEKMSSSSTQLLRRKTPYMLHILVVFVYHRVGIRWELFNFDFK